MVIEAKLTSDDGTVRDKVVITKELEAERNQHVAESRPFYEIVAELTDGGSGNGVKTCGRCC